MDPETSKEAYVRGVAAGEIAARLAGHDKHFAAINGSLADMVTELQRLRMSIQGLGDQATSNAATAVSTAQALKDANQVRREASERSWSPWAKVFATVGAVSTVFSLAYLIFTMLN